MLKTFSIFKSKLTPELQIIILFALARLLLHILCINRYGIFRDELYYIACGEHLDFGYVDQPPFVALVAKLSRIILGESLFAIRFFSVVAASSLVIFAGLLTREFGGSKTAIIMSCLLVFFTPVLLGTGSILSMNTFDQMFWMFAIYLIVRIIKTDNAKLWIWFGVVIGLGFQTKISILFLCFGLFVGFILTAKRKMLLSKYVWLGALIALLIMLPNIIWQMMYNWPTLEFIHNASTYKNAPMTPVDFIMGIAMNMNPVYFLLVPAALWFFFFDKYGKLFNTLGWTIVALFILFLTTNSKTYYMAPIYTLILSAGAVMAARINVKMISTVFGFIITPGIISLPFALPVLPVDQFIKYADFLGIHPKAEERSGLAELPQIYADMFGWESLAETVAGVYNTLTPEQKLNCGIYAQNYGEAGAIDFFGKRMGLPPAYCGHNSYWIWGSRHIRDFDMMIIVGGDPEDHKKVYKDVKIAALNNDKYVMPFEKNRYIYVCSGLKVPIKNVWPSTRFYI